MTKQAFDEIAQNTRELSIGGKQVLEAMTVLQNVTSGVKNASDEMANGSKQIVTSQLELKEFSDHIAIGLKEISSEAEDISLEAADLVTHATELDSVVEALKKETIKFSV